MCFKWRFARIQGLGGGIMDDISRHKQSPATNFILLLLFFLSSLVAPMPVEAMTDEADLLVGLKVLPLLTEKMTGTVMFAIIFDPDNASSKQEAESIKNILDGNFETPGNVKLSPFLVPVNNLDLAVGSKIAFITAGLSKYYDGIGRAAGNGKILTMSTDLACVEANKCVIGIISKPNVEIYYSKSAAEAASIGFSQVFSLLVKQI